MASTSGSMTWPSRSSKRTGSARKGKDNGVLFVLSTADESWRVVTGKGVEGILSGAKLTELQNAYLVPYLDTPGNYSTGITLFVYSIGLELTDQLYQYRSGTQPLPDRLHPAERLRARDRHCRFHRTDDHHQGKGHTLDRSAFR